MTGTGPAASPSRTTPPEPEPARSPGGMVQPEPAPSPGGTAADGDRAGSRGPDSPDDRFAARLSVRTSAEALQRRLVAQEAEHLGSTLRGIADVGSLPRAAALIVAARRRYITGTAKSFGYATLLAGDLAVGLSHVTLIDNATVPALDVLSEVRSSDVMVAYSFRRYRRETVALAREFVAAGGTLVAITDDAAAPLTEPAAEAVVVDTHSASYADSPTAVVAVSHILATLAASSAKGARRRIAARDRLSRDLGIYL